METNGSGLGTGDFRLTLDDKGRILFPAKLRADFSGEGFVMTQGADKYRCLWLYEMDTWKALSARIKGASSQFRAGNRLMMRRFIAPAQQVEFDKSGRLSIPQSLRVYAGLNRDCVLLGMMDYIELWDASSYERYLEAEGGSFQELMEEGYGNILSEAHFGADGGCAGEGSPA